MRRMFGLIYKYSAIKQANHLLSFLQKIPLVGRKIPHRIYRIGGKKLYYILGNIVRQIGNLFGKFFYVGVFLIGSVVGLFRLKGIPLDPVQMFPYFLYFFLVFNVIGTLFTRGRLMDARNRNDFEMVKLARLDEKQYFLSSTLIKHLQDVVPLLIALLVVAALTPLTVLQAVGLLLLNIAARLGAEVFTTALFQVKDIDIIDWGWTQLALLLMIPVTGFGAAYFFDVRAAGQYLLHPITLALAALTIVLSMMYIRKLAIFERLSNKRLKLDTITKSLSAGQEIRMAGGRVKDADLSVEVPERAIGQATGYAYLHKLFYARYRKVLMRPQKVRLIAYTVLFVIAMGVSFFFKKELNDQFLGIYNSLIRVSFYYFYFFGSSGEKFTKILFVNMDYQLLPYSFFREPEAVMQSLKLRFAKMLQISFLPTLLLCVLFTIWAFTFTGTRFLREVLILNIMFAVLSLFFSLHHLIVYHALQPYTQSMEVKSPVYRILNLIIYVMTFALWQQKNIPEFVYLIVLVLMVLYVVGGIQLMKKLAPKNFKMKS